MIVAMDRKRIEAIRHELLTLHRALIEAARIELERIEGRLTSNQMLDRLVTDEQLAWLRPLTTHIVGLDELLDGETPEAEAAGTDYDARLAALLTPEGGEDNPFTTEYARLLLERPEITMAHAAVMRVLASGKP
jgi:hypothetical protein